MIILIPLSGGIDSTFVAYKALSEGNTIIPVYITINNINESKKAIELQQCRKIHELLTKDFGENNVFPLQELQVLNMRSQFACWEKAIKNNINNLPKFNQIHFGTTKSDIDECTTLVRLNQRLEDVRENTFKESYYPILEFTKNEISNLLPKKYQNQVYTCEMPLYKKHKKSIVAKQCGKCNSCHLSKLNKIQLNNFQLIEKIDDKTIQQYNQDHIDNIEWSNFYGQQK